MTRYVDTTGRAWLVRELVEYDLNVVGPDGFPVVVRSTLVFDSDNERRVADDAPLDWRDAAATLAEQFARAARMTPS
jgi:hypothetical protein